MRYRESLRIEELLHAQQLHLQLTRPCPTTDALRTARQLPQALLLQLLAPRQPLLELRH